MYIWQTVSVVFWCIQNIFLLLYISLTRGYKGFCLWFVFCYTSKASLFTNITFLVKPSRLLLDELTITKYLNWHVHASNLALSFFQVQSEQIGESGRIPTTQTRRNLWLNNLRNILNLAKMKDNHWIHSSLTSYNFCRENGIKALSISPHTFHRFKRLDICFFWPLKECFT